MDFTILFFAFAASMWAAWVRAPCLAITLYAAGMVLAAAFYLQHATDALPLSF